MHPRLCDFGLRTVSGFDATQSLNWDTPLYMSSEMHTEEHYHQLVDASARACTADKLLIAECVLGGTRPVQIANATTSGATSPVPPEWSPEFAHLMEKAWAANPNDRSSFAEIISVFDECDFRL
jgi:hypothetical protein